MDGLRPLIERHPVKRFLPVNYPTPDTSYIFPSTGERRLRRIDKHNVYSSLALNPQRTTVSVQHSEEKHFSVLHIHSLNTSDYSFQRLRYRKPRLSLDESSLSTFLSLCKRPYFLTFVIHSFIFVKVSDNV